MADKSEGYVAEPRGSPWVTGQACLVGLPRQSDGLRQCTVELYSVDLDLQCTAEHSVHVIHDVHCTCKL